MSCRSNANPSIKCTVSSCANQNGTQHTCTLDEIKVGCTTSEVSNCAATECASFKLGDHGTCCGK